MTCCALMHFNSQIRHFTHIVCISPSAKNAAVGQTRQMRASPHDLERIIGELELVSVACRQHAVGSSKERLEQLALAVDKIESAITLLKEEKLNRSVLDVENPVRELACCSVTFCRNAAGAVVDGTLLCGQHASEALRRREAR